MKKLFLIKNPDLFQGQKNLTKNKDYFEGWYFKNTNKDNAISFIPGINIENHKPKAFVQVITEEYNEKNCYRIVSSGYVIYIDKETGLTIRVIGDCVISKDNQVFKIVSDYQYEFDIVTDDDFVEPDISEYEVQD